MTAPTPTVRAGEDAGREAARERAAAWLRAYRLDIHEWADDPYPKLETLTREFESFGRHAKAAAEARAAAAEAEVARLKERLQEARDGWERWKGLHAGANTVIRQLEKEASDLRDRAKVLEEALRGIGFVWDGSPHDGNNLVDDFPAMARAALTGGSPDAQA